MSLLEPHTYTPRICETAYTGEHMPIEPASVRREANVCLAPKIKKWIKQEAQKEIKVKILTAEPILISWQSKAIYYQ